MSKLATIPTAAELSKWTTDELRQDLANCLSLTAATLTRAAAVFVELERRGEDLTELRKGWGWTFPMIADGRLAAEAVVRFCGMPTHLRALVGLPLDQQRKIAAGEPIEVVMRDDPKTTVQIPLKQIRADILPVVFQNGEVMPPAAQRVNLRAQAKAIRQQDKTPAKTYRIQTGPVPGTIKVGNSLAKESEVLEFFSAKAGPDKPPPVLEDDPAQTSTRTATAKLWPAEKDALTEYCRRTNLSESEVIRKALRAFLALTPIPRP